MNHKHAAGEQHATARRDVYQIVTDQIIVKLEQGTVPWHVPWATAGVPRNLISRRPYRGINVLMLASLGYEHNLFLTYNQLQTLGGSVRKGEKGHIAVFWTCLEVSVKDTSRDESEHLRKLPYMRYYVVFNVAQCEGIAASMIPIVNRPLEPIPMCEQITEHMPQRPVVQTGKQQRAYYDPVRDYVNMPRFSTFESAESYYGTLFHELVHSTGHPQRLDRKGMLEMHEFTSEAYSHEELVAELGSCYLLSYAGIASQMDASAAYIAGWLERLRSDKRFIVSGSTQAQKAADFILNQPSESQAQEGSTETPKPDEIVGLQRK